MAIIKMKKFTLFTFKEKKEQLLTELQKLEAVEFIDLKSNVQCEEYSYLELCTNEKKLSKLDEEISKINFMITNVEKFIPKEKGLKALLKDKRALAYEELELETQKNDWVSSYKELKTYDENILTNNNEINKLHSEIELLKPWEKLDVSLYDLKDLKTCNALLGTIPKNAKETFLQRFATDISLSVVEVISEKKEDVNILIITHKSEMDIVEELLKSSSFTKSNINYLDKVTEIISFFEDKIKNFRLENLDIVEKIKNHYDHLEEYKLARDYIATEILKLREQNNFLKTKSVIIIQGWIPVNMIDVFESVLLKLVPDECFFDYTDPVEDDQVPILLKNNGFAEAFEPVTAMYSLPSYSEVDPTPIMAPFLLLFFGMMLSDAGYGLIIFITTLWAMKKVPLEASQKKFVKLFFYLSISTMIWGVLYGSYFGDALSKYLKPVWIDSTSDPMTVLLVAIAMGGVHIFVGLGIKGYMLIRDGKWLDAIYDVGFWYVTLVGIILLLLGVNPWGKYLSIVGALGIVLTQGRANKGIIGKLGGGLYELYGITAYLGDFLSYSRLLALGLATGLIGSSFNLMARLVGTDSIAIVFAIVIFVFGHLFNLAINTLGAYVHAARLQYLEYFSKFYTGGGKAFKPFRTDNKYFKIVNKEEF